MKSTVVVLLSLVCMGWVVVGCESGDPVEGDGPSEDPAAGELLPDDSGGLCTADLCGMPAAEGGCGCDEACFDVGNCCSNVCLSRCALIDLTKNSVYRRSYSSFIESK